MRTIWQETTASSPHPSGSRGSTAGCDSWGNTYVGGSFLDSLKWQNSVHLHRYMNTSGVFRSFFLSKFDSLGNELWTISPINSRNAQSFLNNVLCDKSGNVIVTGLFRDTIRLSSTLDLFAQVPTSQSMFIAKYDSSGNLLWALKGEIGLGTYNPNISIDSSENIYFCGAYNPSGNPIVFSIGGTSVSSSRSGNAYIGKIDPLGNVCWLKTTSNNNGTFGIVSFTSLACNNHGEIFVTGGLSGTSGFLAEFSNSISIPFSGLSWDFLIAKYDTSGNAIWANSYPNPGLDLGSSITSDTLGNFYVVGRFDGVTFSITSTVLNNLGNVNGFVAKFNSMGTNLWTSQISGRGLHRATSILTRQSNAIYVNGQITGDTGFYRSQIILPPSNISYPYNTVDFILKIDTTGNPLCMGRFDSTETAIASDSKRILVSPNPTDSVVFFSTGVFLSVNNVNARISKCSCGPDTLRASIGGTQTICNGASGQALIQFSGAGPYSFTYSDGMNNTTVTGVTNRYYFINATPSASVSYTLSAFSGANGPGPYSGMASIQVFTPPTATLSSSQTICQGDSVRLTVNLTGQGPWRFTYTSGVGNVTTTALTSPWTRNLLPSASFTWTINNFNNFVCSGTSPPISTVTVGTRPALTLNASTPLCHNDSIFFTATMSGTPPWQLNYTDGTTPRTLTGLTSSPFLFSDTPAASRTFTLTNATGCRRDTILTRTLLPPLTITRTSTGVSCFGGSNGTAQGIPNGGSGGYTFTWNTLPAQSTATATGLSAGSWILTVTDGLGCVRRDTAFITAPAALSVTLSATPIACFGQSNATATATANGGTSPYSYAWQTLPVQTTSVASSLSAGTWNITVTDANGCNLNNSIVITQPVSALSAQTTMTNVSCYGGNNGSAQAQGVGGTAPYTYTWQTSPIQTTPISTGLSFGSYQLQVRDANGCQNINSVTITQPTPVQVGILSSMTTCPGSIDAVLTAQATGGTAPYTYSWQTIPVQSTITATGLGVGTYRVTITDSQGCSVQGIGNVSSPAPFQLSANITLVSCGTRTDGSIQTNPTGGTSPYQLTWNTIPVQSSTQATGLSTGTYTATLTDNQGCTYTEALVVGTATAMQLITGGQISACVPQIGQATVAVNGGTPGYQYVWNTNPIQTTSTALGLGAGTWQIKVIDSRGCEDSTNVVLTTPPALQLNTTSTDVQCFGQSNGSAQGLGQGGTPPYQYVWNTTPIQTTASITGLRAGQYSIIVYDVFGCTDTAVITIREPSLLQATTTYVSPSCHGGSNGQANVSATGGVMPYSYQWLGGQTTSTILGCSATSYEVRVTDASGCTVDQTVQVTEPPLLQLTMQSSPLTCIQPPNNGTGNVTAQGGTAPYSYQWSGGSSPTNAYNTGLGAGTWSVQVTDIQGCMASGSVVLIAPTYPTITGGTDTFFCKGSGGVMITAQGNGGVLPYTYVWSPNNGSLSNANVQSPLANPDSITCYQVEVIDAAGCRSIVPANVCVTPYEVPLVNAGTDEDYCKDGAAVFISGFIQNPIAGGYDWQWTPSLGLYCDTCPTTYANPNVTTIYTLRATHKLSGCSSDSSTLNSVSAMVVTVKPRPIVYAGMDTVICPIDSAQLWATATGAGPQYSYEWSPSFGLNDSTLQFPKASPTHSVQYYLVATSEGCESLADSVLVSISPVPTVEAGNVKNVCLGDSVKLDGQSQLGFNAQVIWSPAQGLSDTTTLQPMASPVNSRWYYLQAQQGGCKGLPDSVYVVVHPVPQAYAGQDTVICGDSTRITLQGSYTGGGSPIRINWSPGLNAPQNQQLQPIVMPGQTNWYYLQVSSGIPPTQCSTLDSVLITVLPSINLITTQDTGLICVGDSITLMASGGSGAAVFQWSPLSGLSSMVNDNSKVKVSPATSTTYILQASEGGCLEADTFRVQVHPPVSAAFIMSQTKVCVPESEVAFENRSLGAVSITWDFGDNTGLSNENNPLHPFKTPGSYAVRLVAIGIGGCKDTVYSPTKVEVYEGFQPIVNTTPALPLEVSAPGGKVVASETSGQAQQWTWHWGDGTQSNGSTAEHKYNQAGTYKIELYAEDKQGCRGRWESSPIVVQVPEVFIPNVFSPNGDGIGDGFRVEYTGDEYFNLKILDRWGVLLFETHNPQQYWEGKDRNGGEVGAGVYYYQFRIGEKDYPPGNVTLLR